ncbi:MAG TPA: universal stress protein [Candidatus Binataceae bacterium]|nr:universal stress protein [Candidatus Binataceae bacterium]
MINNIKKILAPVDFSEASMKALGGAWELARETNAELHVLHVVVPHHTFIPLPLATSAERSLESVREAAMTEQAEEELRRIKKTDMGDSAKVITATTVGPPVPKIVEYGRDKQVDLIVMATHGRTGPEHLLIGSVTEKIVRQAPCSVLVLR